MFIVFAGLFLAYYWLKPLTIGNDLRYNIFVVALPIAVGLLLFIAYRKKLLDADAVASTKGWKKIFFGSILLLIVALYSFITIGTVAGIAFETINYKVAEKSNEHTIILPIERYFKGTKRQGVYFVFQGHQETLRLNRTDVKKYSSSGYKHIKLTIRKGIWNHYIVDEYEFLR